MQLTPRPYQYEGINWLRSKRRAMLTDAPGLGKTLQASAAADLPCLILCPSYLIDQWADFLTAQYPNTTISIATGVRANRQQALDQRADWTIANIEMLGERKARTSSAKLSYNFPTDHYQTVIIDESHHLRGHDTSRSRRAADLCKQAKRVYLLTATPIVKEGDDLFGQLRILDPARFTSYNRFCADYLYLSSGWFGVRVLGMNKHAVTRLMADYALGRTYKAVGMYLPPLIEKTVTVRMTPEDRKSYCATRDAYRYEGESLTSAIEVLNMLRYLTFTKEKVEALHEILDYDKRPTIVFTWFRETATALHQLFGGVLITGDMPPNHRKALAQQSTRVFATIASLCEGVDLSHAKTVAFFEEDYTPGRMYQALSRAHRANSNPEPVLCYYLHVKSTVDEAVHGAVTRRSGDVRAILKEVMKDKVLV
jgi:SWI/SNF-related matrix-associated actin-dependent regulator of chromatin subfamily A-like protein 1